MKYINTYTNRVAEFEAKEKEKYLNSRPVSQQAIKNGIPATFDKRFVKNPYELAREKILLDMPASQRAEILRMENKNNKDNATYREFISRVARLGDNFSNS